MAEIIHTDMPAPDLIVRYDDGTFAPAMFHYLHEGVDIRAIAREHNFELKHAFMEDVLDEDDPLALRYEADSGDASIIRDWSPPEFEGWRIVGKYESEDGPIAIYLCPVAKNSSEAA